MMFYVYIIYSERIKRYYVGSTESLEDRLHRHNAGQSRYTRQGVPWKLVFTHEMKTRSEAVRLEKKVKKRGIARFLEDNKVRGVAQSG